MCARSSGSSSARATQSTGIERLRFTSPHPKDFRDPVIAAMAECASVCEHAHLPLQSGSSRDPQAMRRTYDRSRYLAARGQAPGRRFPDLALGTDLIVGFPGETDDDFEADSRRGRGGAVRERVHVHLLAARGHRGGRHAGPGSGRGEARAPRAPRRGGPADRAASGTPSASGASRRCSSRARAAPIRRCSVAGLAETRRSTSPERRLRRPRGRADRRIDLDHSSRSRGVAVAA